MTIMVTCKQCKSDNVSWKTSRRTGKYYMVNSDGSFHSMTCTPITARLQAASDPTDRSQDIPAAPVTEIKTVEKTINVDSDVIASLYLMANGTDEQAKDAQAKLIAMFANSSTSLTITETVPAAPANPFSFALETPKPQPSAVPTVASPYAKSDKYPTAPAAPVTTPKPKTTAKPAPKTDIKRAFYVCINHSCTEHNASFSANIGKPVKCGGCGNLCKFQTIVK